jgi:hypothetical protein
MLRAQFQARGALGVLVGWAATAQTWRNARLLEADLGHYMRHGTPSPRKQRQLSRAAKSRRAAHNRDGESRESGW